MNTPEPENKPAVKDVPFVSVIVPVYNAESMIGECIESLLNQDYPEDRYEVIIVDNDSTDGTAEVIKRYPVKYVLEDNIHTSYAARNAGARVAKGEALAFCDADQIADEKWLRFLLSSWHNDHYVAFTGPVPVFPVNNSLAASVFADAVIGGQLSSTDHTVEIAPTSNFALSKARFEQVGGFRADIPTGEDYGFSMRLRMLTDLQILFVGKAIQWHRSRETLCTYLKANFRGGFQMDLRRRGKLETDYIPLGKAVRNALFLTVTSVPVALRNTLVRSRGLTRGQEFIGPFMIAANRWAGVAGRLSGRVFGESGLPRGW